MTSSTPESPDLEQIYAQLQTWGLWGNDDERGSLNYLTPSLTVAASRLVDKGITVSLGRDLVTQTTPENPVPADHEMLASGEDRHSSNIPGYEASRDRIGTEMHGTNLTHIDALSHMFVRGEMYNGRPASLVQDDGALANSVMTMAGGIAGRGVFLDVPAARGVPFLDEDDAITIDDLDAAQAYGGVEVSQGDLVLISTGRESLRRARGSEFSGLVSGMAGLHPECLTWLADRRPSVLGSDGISDRMPPRSDPSWPFPIHQIAITAMGLHLIDAMEFTELSQRCQELGRWTFMTIVNVLRVPGGTASPVNPIAIF